MFIASGTKKHGAPIGRNVRFVKGYKHDAPWSKAQTIRPLKRAEAPVASPGVFPRPVPSSAVVYE